MPLGRLAEFRVYYSQARQVGVDEDLGAEAARAVLRLEGRLDLVLPREEVEHVARLRLRDDNLQRRHTTVASGAFVYMISTG